MKQTIEIDVPYGKIAVWEDGKLIFKQFLPETWEEYYNFYLSKNSPNNYTIPYDIPNRTDDQYTALIQLHHLRDCYRQGWIPDWTDDENDKWCIEYDEDEYQINDTFYSRSFLSFQDYNLAKEFLDNFRDLIEQAGDLI